MLNFKLPSYKKLKVTGHIITSLTKEKKIASKTTMADIKLLSRSRRTNRAGFLRIFRRKKTVDPIDLLEQILHLYKNDFLTIRQEPITALGQGFGSKIINPINPDDIIGDLKDDFERFRKKKDYLQYANIGTKAGVPMGIWIEMTKLGRKEWNNTKYEIYYEKSV